MRITDIHVDGFGVWHDLELRSLSREVTVFYGLNEAGKTTLMHFLRSMLYGVSAERRAAYLPPVHDGRPGGTLGVDTDDGSFRLARFADRGPDDTGRVTVTLPDGTTQGDRLLREAVEHVDEDTCSNVFALGLDEIQHLGTLSGTEAARNIYRLTSGLDRVSLYDVIQGLRTSRRRIVGGGEAPSQLQQLLQRRSHLVSEIEQRSSGTRQWSALAVQAHEIDDQLATLRDELRQADHRARRVELAINIRPHWQQRDDLRNQLRRFDNLYELESDAIDELDALNERIEEHRRQRDMLKGQRHQLREEAEELGINDVLCRSGCRVEALGEQQEWLESLAEQAEQYEAEASELESRLQAESERLASQWLGDANQRLDLSTEQIDQLAPQQQALETAQQQLAEAEEAVDSFRSEEDKFRSQLESTMTSSDMHGLPSDLQEAGDLVARLRRRLQVEQRIEQARRNAIDLEQQAHETLDEQVMPLGWYLTTLATLAAGAGLVAWWFIGGQSSYGQAGGVLCAVAIIVPMYRKWAELNAGDQLDACHRQIETLEKQLTEAQQERDQLDEELPLTEGSVVLRLQTAERHLNELEAMLPVETQRRQATEASRAAQRDLEAARTRLASAAKSWEGQLKALGLPTGLTPPEVKLLAGRYEQLAELSARADHRREDVARRQKEFNRVVGRIQNLAEEAHLVIEDASPLEQLEYLLEQSRLQKASLAHRAKLRERAKELKQEEARHARAAIGLDRQREARFQTAGVDDEPAYRQLAADLAEATSLRQQINEITRQVAVAIGNGREESDFADLMAPAAIHTLESTWEQLTGEHDSLENRVAELVKQHGTIEAQQQTLVDDRRLAECQLELGVVDAQIADAEEAWRERAVVSFFLERIRHDYEQHRQPETLREASEYFARLTAGQYTRVWTPLANDILLVDRGDGTSLGVESLSRGTREQLFLSIRLALVAMYARRGIQLPMVLDDVLVNYDERRAARAAEVLVEFARDGHQLLVFTCHEHIWSIFRHLKSDVRRLPVRGEQPAEDEPQQVEPIVEAIEPADEPPAPVVEEVVELDPPVVEETSDDPVEFEYTQDIPDRIARDPRSVEYDYAMDIPERAPVEPTDQTTTVVEYDWAHDDYGESWIPSEPVAEPPAEAPARKPRDTEWHTPPEPTPTTAAR